MDRKTETVQPYYAYVGRFMEKHFGRAPSRTTLQKYMKRGFPVRRGGPYVTMPMFYELKRPMTTTQSMSRFLTLVRKLEKTAA